MLFKIPSRWGNIARKFWGLKFFWLCSQSSPVAFCQRTNRHGSKRYTPPTFDVTVNDSSARRLDVLGVRACFFILIHTYFYIYPILFVAPEYHFADVFPTVLVALRCSIEGMNGDRFHTVVVQCRVCPSQNSYLSTRLFHLLNKKASRPFTMLYIKRHNKTHRRVQCRSRT